MLLRLNLPRDAHAPAQARGALTQAAGDFDRTTIDNARLLVSELVANSAQHGSGDTITVVIDGDLPGVLRCEVIDAGNGFVPRGRGARTAGGWGLHLVDRVASNWGVRDGSTRVWFELATDRPA
jgi:anti-sigma regulatory factor (Ser/Thr protein kinase)